MKSTLTAFGALAVLTCLLFIPALQPDSVFYFRDVSQNHHPYRALTLSMLSEGELPLWNPHRGAGQPLLANPNALVLHPTTLLFLILPFEWAFKLSVILQVMLAAFATWLLLRDIGVRPGAATLGASLFAFSGYVVSLGNLINLLDSVAFMPLTLWLAGRVMTRGFAPWGSLAALSLAVQIMAGEPSILIGTAAAFVALHWSAPRREARSVTVRAAGLLGLLLMAGVLSMAGTLPALELIARAERSQGFDREESLKWSLPPLALAETAIPGLFGDPTRADPSGYWGGRLFDSGLPFVLSLYLGPGALILAGIGLRRGLSGGRRPRRESLALAGLSVAGLALSLGRFLPVYPLLLSLAPPLQTVRYPVKYFVLIAWAVSLLAARGYDGLSSEDRGNRGAAGAAARGGAVGLAVAAAGLALVHWSGTMTTLIASSPESVLSSLHGSIARCALVSAAVCALCLVRPSRLARLGLMLIPVLDVAAAAMPLNPVAPSEFYSETPLLKPLLQADHPERLWAMPRPRGFAFRTPSGTAEPGSLRWGFRWDRMTLRNATYFPEHLDFAYDRGNERLDVMPGASVGRLLYENAGEALPAAETERLLSVAGVSHVISYGDLEVPGFSETRRLEGESNVPVVLLRNASALPRAYFVEKAEIEPDTTRALRRVRSLAFDPARSVILEDRVPVPAATGEGASPALVTIDERSARRVSITVSTDRAGYLVLADTYYPGWRALVDGVEAPIVRANAMFRAVPLGAGTHEVEFLFRPRSVRSGALVSALGLILAGFLAWPRRR